MSLKTKQNSNPKQIDIVFLFISPLFAGGQIQQTWHLTINQVGTLY